MSNRISGHDRFSGKMRRKKRIRLADREAHMHVYESVVEVSAPPPQGVVLDTCVYLASVTTENIGKLRLSEVLIDYLFAHPQGQQVPIYYCRHILNEIGSAGSQKLSLAPSQIQSIQDKIIQRGELTRSPITKDCRFAHKADRPIVATAITANTEFLVTCDKGLSKRGLCGQTRILSPEDYLAIIQPPARPPSFSLIS